MRQLSVRHIALIVAVGLLVGTSAGSYAAFSNSAGSSGNTFSAASTFGCNTTNPNVSWLTGVEHGVLSTAGAGLFDYVLSATADSTVRRTGVFSMRINAAAGASAYAAKTSGGTALVMRFALRFATLPSADVVSIASTYVSAGSNLSLGYRASDQKLTLGFGGTSSAASTTAVSAGTWYVIDMKAELGANPRTGAWRIDGVAQPSVSSAEPATSNTLAGFGTTVAGDVYTVNLDDIAASSSAADYPIGDGQIRALLPNGVGTHNNPGNFRHTNGTNIDSTSWNRLDDLPMDSLADGVMQTTSSGTSSLAFAFADPPATACIRAVSAVMAYHASGGAPNDGKASIFDGAVERTVFSGDMSETSLFYKSAVITPDVSPWTQAAVSGLIARVGYSTDVNPDPIWDALMLEYESAP